MDSFSTIQNYLRLETFRVKSELGVKVKAKDLSNKLYYTRT